MIPFYEQTERRSGAIAITSLAPSATALFCIAIYVYKISTRTALLHHEPILSTNYTLAATARSTFLLGRMHRGAVFGKNDTVADTRQDITNTALQPLRILAGDNRNTQAIRKRIGNRQADS